MAGYRVHLISWNKNVYYHWLIKSGEDRTQGIGLIRPATPRIGSRSWGDNDLIEF